MRTRAIVPCLGRWAGVPAAVHHPGGGAADRGVRRRPRPRPPPAGAPGGGRAARAARGGGRGRAAVAGAVGLARPLGRPWPAPLEEVVSVRPVRDVYAVGPGRGWRWLTHSRRYTATGAGTLVAAPVDWAAPAPGRPRG